MLLLLIENYYRWKDLTFAESNSSLQIGNYNRPFPNLAIYNASMYGWIYKSLLVFIFYNEDFSRNYDTLMEQELTYIQDALGPVQNLYIFK